MTLCVFLGPSLDWAQARIHCDATYLPPARCGDLYRVAKAGPQAIALIDGVFDCVPSVWHKEILYALQKGIPVYGAASMGALRAAELASFGMIGVGSIFDAFHSGALEDDDEVALAHASGDAGFRPLSEAMVNLRTGLVSAHASGVISESTRGRLVEVAKRMFYPDRSWAAVYREAETLGIDADERRALVHYVQTEKPNQKRDDAIAVLQRLAADAGRGFVAPSVDFELAETTFWRMLTLAIDLDMDVHRALRHHVLATGIDPEVRAMALLFQLVSETAGRLGLVVPDDLRKATEQRWSHLRDRLSGASHTAFVELEALVEMLARDHMTAMAGQLLPFALMRSGGFEAARSTLAARAARLAKLGLERPSLEDAGIDLNELLTWYSTRHRPIDVSIDEYAQAMGLSLGEFISETVAQYLDETS